MNRYPLRVEARRDESLSRWLWLVKWLLLIPHYLVLAVLWVGFIVLTLVAYLAVLFTGRYPHAIYAYNLGVLRWSWRVNYYGYQALGTDRYPPFTLADLPDYPARLQVDEPPRPARWLPLVAWLFAVPHILIVAALTGAATWQFSSGDNTTSVPLGVVTVGIAVAALGLLFAGRYPRGLYDLLLGVARWNLRVTAYLALLTPRYPPFRLDQGEREPDDDPTGPDRAPIGESRSGNSLTEPGNTVESRRGGSIAGPVAALVAGAVLLLPAIGTGAAGAALLAFSGHRDSSGYVTSSLVRTSSTTAAVTAEGITIQGGDLWTRGLADVGGVRITAHSTTSKAVFIGIARQSAVDAWIDTATHDRIVGITTNNARLERTDGMLRPVSAPAEQDFWLASATGSGTATLDWRATNGDFTVVLANADGSTGVAADIQASAQIPDLSGLGGGLLAAGIILGLIAIGLIIMGAVGLGGRHSGPPTAAGPPLPGPPPEYVAPAPPVPTAS
jgi:hypothetical protein